MHAAWRRLKLVQVAFAVLATALLAPRATCQAQISPWQTAMQSAEESLARGDVEQSEATLKQAIALAEETAAGEEDLALSLTVLASVYHGTGRYSAAEPLLLRALPLAEKVHGSDHPDVARILGNLGLLYHARGNFAEANKHYQRSFEILEATYGPDYPELILTLNNLGALDVAEKRYAEGEEHYKHALTVADHATEPVGRYLTVTLQGYASLLNRQGRYAEARALEKRVDSIEKGSLISAKALIILAVPLAIVVAVVVVLATGVSRGKKSMAQVGTGEARQDAEVSRTAPPEGSEP